MSAHSFRGPILVHLHPQHCSASASFFDPRDSPLTTRADPLWPESSPRSVNLHRARRRDHDLDPRSIVFSHNALHGLSATKLSKPGYLGNCYLLKPRLACPNRLSASSSPLAALPDWSSASLSWPPCSQTYAFPNIRIGASGVVPHWKLKSTDRQVFAVTSAFAIAR